MVCCSSFHSGNSPNNASAHADTSCGNCTFGLIAAINALRLFSGTNNCVFSPTHFQNSSSDNCINACVCQNNNCCSLNFAGDLASDSVLNSAASASNVKKLSWP